MLPDFFCRWHYNIRLVLVFILSPPSRPHKKAIQRRIRQRYSSYFLEVKRFESRPFGTIKRWSSRKRWRIEQTVRLPTHRKSLIGFQLVYLHLTFAFSKAQGQGRAYFDRQNIAKRLQIGQASLLSIDRMSPIGLWSVYLLVTLGHSTCDLSLFYLWP